MATKTDLINNSILDNSAETEVQDGNKIERRSSEDRRKFAYLRGPNYRHSKDRRRNSNSE